MILIVPLKEREIYTPILPSEVIGTCVGHHGAKRDKDVEQQNGRRNLEDKVHKM